MRTLTGEGKLIEPTLMLQELLSCHTPVLVRTGILSFIENYSVGREDLIKLV